MLLRIEVYSGIARFSPR